MSKRPPHWILITIMATVVVLIVAFVALAEQPQQIKGKAEVIDGDTIRVGNHRVRIFGINSPEIRYAVGAYASVALRKIVAGKEVTCLIVNRDKYNRLVGRCSISDVDIGWVMVISGWAVNADSFTSFYEVAESSALRSCVGMWSGDMCWKSSYLVHGSSD